MQQSTFNYIMNNRWYILPHIWIILIGFFLVQLPISDTLLSYTFGILFFFFGFRAANKMYKDKLDGKQTKYILIILPFLCGVVFFLFLLIISAVTGITNFILFK